MTRQRGEGSIAKLPSGSYRARISLGGVRYDDTLPTAREAADYLADLRKRHRGGSLNPKPSAATRTVGEQLEHFLTAVRGEVDPKTWGEHERSARIHLRALAPLTLAELSPTAWRSHQAALGLPPHNLAPRTIHRVRTTLRRALRLAVDDLILDRNVVDLVRRPKAPKIRYVVHSRSQQRQLERDAEARSEVHQNAGGERLAALWTLGYRIGARVSELIGLTWGDVDVEAGTVRIWRQLDTSIDRAPVWKETKTESSVGVVQLPYSAVAALLRHRARQDGEKLRHGSAYHDYGLVFCTRWGTPLTPEGVAKSWKRACRRANVPVITFHQGTRHTAASTYIKSGSKLTEVQAILRHASTQVTASVYAHELETADRGPADRMDAYLDEDEKDADDGDSGSKVGAR